MRPTEAALLQITDRRSLAVDESLKSLELSKFSRRVFAAAASLAVLAAAAPTQAQTLPADRSRSSHHGPIGKPRKGNADPQTQPGIGQWDGITASAELADPYEDPKQLNVPFGIISYYNQPWRGYMDTWPASQYLKFPGVVWSLNSQYASPICQILQDSGIRSVRIEIGWSNIGWDDNLTPAAQASIQSLFGTFKAHGIRPLILLNANQGLPCPYRYVKVTVAAPASAGSKVLKLASYAGVRPGYTGIQNPAYIAAYPVITAVDPDGTAHLSSGLPANVPAGSLTLIDLKYQPFQAATLPNGTSVPAAYDTYNGWMKYVAAVGTAARAALGTIGQADAGFDIEVWNELSFGSSFLDINNYYDQPINTGTPFTYVKTRSSDGLKPGAQTTFTSQGAQSILPMTVDYFNNPANGFPGVNVISGFSNQSPWASGASLWPGQAGFSRHYYTGGWTDCSATNQISSPAWGVVNALGNIDGQLNGIDWATIVPGTDFVPTLRVSFPEQWFSGLITESVIRDVVPDSRESGMPSYAGAHGRYTDNGDLHPAQVWQTETNYWRQPFFAELAQQTGISATDPRMANLDQWLSAKMMLRQYLFESHKGLSKIFDFSLGVDQGGFGMLPQALLTALNTSGGAITPAVQQAIPLGLKAMTWINSTMSDSKPLDSTCALTVNDLVEYKPRLVFAGDGTAAHPDKWNRDQFAFLPFELSANQYEIPYYVMTMDVTHVWDPTADPLDPARYNMPDQDFDVTIGNICGDGATVSAYDPLQGTVVPVTVAASTPTTLTVRLKAVDYPRFLQVTEAKDAPLILDPKVSYLGNQQIQVTWGTNTPVKASITYGNGWQNRSANEVALPTSSSLTQTYTIPNAKPGVTAVRIKVVSSGGLTTTWPRWDEDPAGQVVVPSTP